MKDLKIPAKMKNRNQREFSQAKEGSVGSVKSSNDDCCAPTSATLNVPSIDVGHPIAEESARVLCQNDKEEENNQKSLDQQEEKSASAATAAASESGNQRQEPAAVDKQEEHEGQGEQPQQPKQQEQQQQGDKNDNQKQTEVEQPKKRCDKCGKKLGLTGGFPCRCGGTFCGFHRYSDRHECNFDYREMGASEIRRDNPVIVASKLRKL